MRTKACSQCGTFNSVGAKECKDCGASLGSPKKEFGGVDGRCAWEDFGQRCRNTGTFSDATTGDGPWWCRRHERMRLGRGDPGNVHVETPEERYIRLIGGRSYPPLERGNVLRSVTAQMTAMDAKVPQQVGDDIPP